MSEYKNILLAVDFTDYGEYVAQRAKSLANQCDARLSIIHILDNIPMPDTTYGTVIPLDMVSDYEMLETEKEKLVRVAYRLNIDPNRCWLIWGEPKEEIPLFAEKNEIDLIVVGSHGRHGIELLLGSTANGVLHHAKCDVLAVRLLDD